MSNKTWKNAFAPALRNEYFAPETLFGAVRYAEMLMSDLPDDAQEAVRKIAREVYRR